MTTHAFKEGSAAWIWSSEGAHQRRADGATHYEVRRFRRQFEVDAPANTRLTVHVSADSHYLLYVNGTLVGRGPAKGDVRHQFFETCDVTPHLRQGKNVLAALVLDYSGVLAHPPKQGAPTSVMTYRGGFALDGTLEPDGTSLATNPEWRVMVDETYGFQNEQDNYGGFVGYFEHFHGSREPRGWHEPGFDDSSWEPATVLYAAIRGENKRDTMTQYGLCPSLVPPLMVGPETAFRDVFVPGGGDADAAWRNWVTKNAAMEISAHSEARVILDVGELTTAYPRLTLSGGLGSEVRLTYAEALRLPYGTPGANILGDGASLANVSIGYADETTGWTFDKRGSINGLCDIIEPNGDNLRYEPLTWRTFRYVELFVRTGENPLQLESVCHCVTRYPYERKARFSCSDPAFEQYWEMCLRTFHLCSHETFEDCPYYEQMQYAGDTMITSQLGMLTAGDSRLSRQAVYHFAWSLLPEGITQSRYPSRLEQVIPSWSLHWISMVHDYLLYTGDRETIHDVLPAVRQVLAWFRRHVGESGLPERLHYWNVTDWCPEWDRGQPPGWETQPTCVISGQFLLALREAAWLEAKLGNTRIAAELESEYETSREIFNQLFWSEKEGLYLDRPNGPEMSQYGNAWGICSGAADAPRLTRIATRFPSDPKLAPASFFGLHFVNRALHLLGVSDRLADLLACWRDMADAGLSTCAEETLYWRSLCHAWSAHPALAFLNGILGITPASIGFTSARIAPQPTGLSWAEGEVPTPQGPLSVRWSIKDGDMDLEVRAPAGMPVEIVAPDGEVLSFDGGSFKQVLACTNGKASRVLNTQQTEKV